MAVTFADVKAVLDEAIAGWKERTGREPKLTQRHASPTFGFATREQLLNAVAFGTYRLIDPEMIGNGRGAETNIVIALSNPDGVEGLGQMPYEGPFLEQAKIDIIKTWIDEGANE
jgi:hypothetical protein